MSSIILQAPCATCPFRKDRNFFLYPSRRQEIAQSLLEGATFSCHNTVDWNEDGDDWGDGESYDHSKTKHCAGAAKSLMLSGGTTQMMRIAERLGDIDLEALEDRGPEVWPLDEWQRLNDAGTEIEAEEIEPCETCNPGCLAPAGTLGNSGAILSGTESADGECAECGSPLCSNCADMEGLCYMCVDPEGDGDY